MLLLVSKADDQLASGFFNPSPPPPLFFPRVLPFFHHTPEINPFLIRRRWFDFVGMPTAGVLLGCALYVVAACVFLVAVALLEAFAYFPLLAFHAVSGVLFGAGAQEVDSLQSLFLSPGLARELAGGLASLWGA